MKLRRGEGGASCCERCDLSRDENVVEALGQVASLPDAAGSHPRGCGHPEMRLLPDGIFHCPSCGTEATPTGAAGRTGPLSRPRASPNDGLKRWEVPFDRLRFYQGYRAGREALLSETASPAG